MLLRLRSAWFGLTLPLRALKTIAANPLLIGLSVLPVAITLALYGFLISHLQDSVRAAIEHRFATESWAGTLALWLARIGLVIAGALTFSFVASVAASPFNDLLAEKTEARAVPPLEPVRGVSLSRKIRLIGIDLLKTVSATAASLLALLLSWAPGLNLAAFAFAFLLVCFQFTSYPQTRRGVGLRDGMRFLWRHFFACVSFGFALSVLFSIPFVASLALPLAVVGGTLLVARAPGGGGARPLK